MSPEDLLMVEVRWSFDPTREFWFTCEVDGHCFSLRLNYFPDENFYSLDRGDGTFLELEGIPPQWTLTYPPSFKWPASAAPRWSEDELFRIQWG